MVSVNKLREEMVSPGQTSTKTVERKTAIQRESDDKLNKVEHEIAVSNSTPRGMYPLSTTRVYCDEEQMMWESEANAHKAAVNMHAPSNED